MAFGTASSTMPVYLRDINTRPTYATKSRPTNLIFVVSNWHFIGVPGTVGLPGRYTGTYAQFRADWAITTYSSFAIEAVHFVVGDAIRRAGGHDSNYLGVQIAYGW
jgi:hypothetical protein